MWLNFVSIKDGLSDIKKKKKKKKMSRASRLKTNCARPKCPKNIWMEKKVQR